jgi:predicted molibdopterin-dependent oxidoreductase YjgC
MANDLVTITVNGEETEAPSGEILLHTLRREGITVPTLCHDERLTPYGGCRLCVVARRDGRGGLVASCSTPVQRGMVIETDPPEVIESRRKQLQLLVMNHRMECPVCERRGDCRLQDLVFEYGCVEEELPFERVLAPRDEKSPVIVRDPEKCIICGKCVRICDEVQGVAAIGVVDRGLEARVATLLERPLDCEFCGQCVNACPVGALVARPYVSDIPAWQRQATTTTCSFCSCGCQITAETAEGALQRVTADVAATPNHGKLCVKGWLGWDILDDPDRLETPLVRRDGRLVEASWSEALQAVVEGLSSAREAGRPVAGLGSSRLTCEGAYLMQRLMRSTLGSPHIGAGPVGGIQALVEGIGELTGVPRSSATFDDLAAADVVLVLRGDPARTHPLVKTELVQGSRQRGQRLIVAHSLSGGLERSAEMYLPLAPASETAFLNAVATRVRQRHPELAEHAGRLPGFTEWSASLEAYSPEVAAQLTAIDPGRFEEVAERLVRATSVVAVVVGGMGIPGDEAAVTRAATQLMALLAGSGKPSGVLVLGEKANVQGVLDVGLHPTLLPGHRGADDQAAREAVEKVWGGGPLPGAGWTSREVFSRSARGEIGALYLVGQDPVKAWPQGLCAREAVEGAGFVVVQDAFLTETARLADVVLPVRILAEREGTLVGADGVRRSLQRVETRPNPLPQDAEIFIELARRLGSDLPADEDLEREMTELINWRPQRVPLRHFKPAPRPAERPPWSGILLDASPQLCHSGSVTLRSRQLQQLAPTVAVRLSPADARELDVESGETLRLATDERELLLRARLDRTVRRGTVVVPWHSGRGGSAAALITEIGAPQAVNVRRSR